MREANDLIITLATRNEGKRLELERWLQQRQSPIQLVLNESVGDIEETGGTFLENALIKAQATPPVVPGGWVLAEDSGLVVDALDGLYGLSPFPGLKSNRWLTPALRDTLLAQAYPNRMPLDRMTDSGVSNTDLCYGILALLGQNPNRSARYCCGMVLWNPARQLTIEALESIELGVIDGEPRGINGFGYDPVMLLRNEAGELSANTVAELSSDEKNQISHRGKAFQAILSALARETGIGLP
ncbi:non-canonical purine NTP pyrophosphatase [Vampirovibrio chlorellavorus]|uniref:non-canonical purine NTP pyrophosphatase n=1 Tax=Vampirovibrio chlorellavorus TaxID=758823 RepID=UPI0026EBA824|nr:non-canonical purine NTP pyrophosphatase [Vampirovibrio chlorellavorus]